MLSKEQRVIRQERVKTFFVNDHPLINLYLNR